MFQFLWNHIVICNCIILILSKVMLGNLYKLFFSRFYNSLNFHFELIFF